MADDPEDPEDPAESLADDLPDAPDEPPDAHARPGPLAVGLIEQMVKIMLNCLYL